MGSGTVWNWVEGNKTLVFRLEMESVPTGSPERFTPTVTSSPTVRSLRLSGDDKVTIGTRDDAAGATHMRAARIDAEEPT